MKETSCRTHNTPKVKRNICFYRFYANANLPRIYYKHLKRPKTAPVYWKLRGICTDKTKMELPADKARVRKKVNKLKIGPMVPLKAAQVRTKSILEEHNYCITKQGIMGLQDTAEYLAPLYEDLKTQVLALKQHINAKNKYITTLTMRSSPATIITKRDPFLLQWTDFTLNPEGFKFLTGFDNTSQFERLLEFMTPAFNDVQANDIVKSVYVKNLLPLADQLFLVLCYLKLGYHDRDIAQSFQITNAAYDRIWHFWLNLLYEHLTSIPIWPQIRPSRSRTVIVDTTKVCDGGKCLIGVCPNGMLCYASNVYPITSSDDHLFEQCGILELLNSGDRVFADRGFSIDDTLKHKMIIFNRPLNVANNCFVLEEVIRMQSVSERVIRNLKEYKILVTTNAPWTLKVWKICCYLINFKRKDFVPLKIL